MDRIGRRRAETNGKRQNISESRGECYSTQHGDLRRSTVPQQREPLPQWWCLPSTSEQLSLQVRQRLQRLAL